MIIAGLVRSSLIDYPGKVSAVVFLQGCNFRCGFCHNPDLIKVESEKDGAITEKEFFAFLSKRLGRLDGVVLTGGEPLLSLDIESFIARIKKMGYLVKLDTNGSNPVVLKRLLDKKLVDYVAMDIKGTLEKYQEICSYPNKDIIQKTINLLLENKVDYEFRTTVLPKYHSLNDFKEIGKLLSGASRYVVQGFRPEITLDKKLASEKPFTRDELETIAGIMDKYVQEVIVRDNIS